MLVFYWKVNLSTDRAPMRDITITQVADSASEASKMITNKIIGLSRRGIPRIYLNGNLMCFSHSNDRQMLDYEYVEVDGRLYQYLTITLPDMIMPHYIRQQGLNYNAPVFIPYQKN